MILMPSDEKKQRKTKQLLEGKFWMFYDTFWRSSAGKAFIRKMFFYLNLFFSYLQCLGN